MWPKEVGKWNVGRSCVEVEGKSWEECRRAAGVTGGSAAHSPPSSPPNSGEKFGRGDEELWAAPPLNELLAVWRMWLESVDACFEVYEGAFQAGKLRPKDEEIRRSGDAEKIDDGPPRRGTPMSERGRRELWGRYLLPPAGYRESWRRGESVPGGSKNDTLLHLDEVRFAFIHVHSRSFQEGLLPLLELLNTNGHRVNAQVNWKPKDRDVYYIYPIITNDPLDRISDRVCLRAGWGDIPAGTELTEDYSQKLKDPFWFFNQYGFSYDAKVHRPSPEGPAGALNNVWMGGNKKNCAVFEKAFRVLDTARNTSGPAANFADFAERVCGLRSELEASGREEL